MESSIEDVIGSHQRTILQLVSRLANADAQVAAYERATQSYVAEIQALKEEREALLGRLGPVDASEAAAE